MKSRSSSGVMESTQPVQMGGGANPNWWSIRPSIPPVTSTITSYQQHQHHPPYNLLLYPPNNNTFFPFNSTSNSIILPPYSPQPASSSSNSSSWHDHDNNHHQLLQDNGHQQHPSDTWSNLLLNRMGQDEGENQSASTAPITQQFQLTPNTLKLQIWEQEQSPLMLQQQQRRLLHDLNNETPNSLMGIKQEHHSVPSSCYETFGHGNEEFLAANNKTTAAWSSIVMPNSSPPKSCVTSFVNNNNSMLDFSSNKKGDELKHPAPDHQSESNSSATGGASKKARVQPSPPQSNTIKVRKEKLGDRITALHQLVSPFGKTDTASVLLETMGYIRFLESQIEALSLPYLGSGSSSTRQQQLQVHAQGESICIFPEDPVQLLNDNSIKRKAEASSDLQQISEKDPKKDLTSRGLCLVPVSCTLQQVGSDNGADYWAPPPVFGGGFR